MAFELMRCLIGQAALSCPILLSLSPNHHLCCMDFWSPPHSDVYLLGVCLPRDAGSPQWASDSSAVCCSPRKTYPRWHRSGTQSSEMVGKSWQRLRGLQCAEKTLGCNTGAWAVVAAGTSLVGEKGLAVSGVEEGKRHCWRAVQKGPTI